MSIGKPKLYLETTVPSYLVARASTDILIAGHQHVTRAWWEYHLHDYEIFISELVIEEAARGDPEAAKRRCVAVDGFHLLQVTDLAVNLAGVYLHELPLPAKAEADALHLALATIHEMDYLLTWNCRHIARGSVKRALPAVNAARGYGTPTICTPEELLYEDPGSVD